MIISEFGQHASENFQPEVFLVAQAVCATLDDADFVVQSFHESKRDLVLWLAVSGDSVPMPIDHLSELLVGLEPLPLQARAPVLEEAPSPNLTAVVPQLPEGFLEHIGRVQALVGRQQQPEGMFAFQREVVAVGQQRVFLGL